MQLTKFGHACVRVQGEGGTLVLDPGAFTEDAALDGADALLITHEHADHFVEARVRAAVQASPGLEVWTVSAVAASLDGLGDRLHVVGHGDAFTAAGFDVQAHGSMHEDIHPDVPRVTNTGFLLDGAVFHPGDALTVPGTPVDTLLLPVHAPWSRTGDLVDWVRAVRPRQALAVHDGLLNDTGLGVVGRLLGEAGPGTGAPYRRLVPGETVDTAAGSGS